MRKTILLLTVLFLLGCKSGGDNSNDEGSGGGGGTPGSTTKLYIMGTWSSAGAGSCVAVGADMDGDGNNDFATSRYEFVGDNSGGTAANYFLVYADSGCTTTMVYRQKVTGPFAFGAELSNGALEIDMAATGNFVTPWSASMVANMNAAQYCQRTNWAMGVEQDVSSEMGCAAGGTVYTIVKIPASNTNELYFGDFNTGAGTSHATRPTSVTLAPQFVRY